MKTGPGIRKSEKIAQETRERLVHSSAKKRRQTDPRNLKLTLKKTKGRKVFKITGLFEASELPFGRWQFAPNPLRFLQYFWGDQYEQNSDIHRATGRFSRRHASTPFAAAHPLFR
jgi:hypothetical protein